jgi:hypothetical protein
MTFDSSQGPAAIYFCLLDDAPNGFVKAALNLSPPSPPLTNTAQISPPSTPAAINPIGGGVANGQLQPGNYFLTYTYVTSYGETTVSPEVSFSIVPGNIPTMTLVGVPGAATSINIYLTAPNGASGTEVLYAPAVAMQLSKPPLFGYGLLLGLSPAASQSQSVYNLTLPINVANQGVLAMPGISFMDFGAFDVAGNLVFTDQGYLIVNRSRWGATSSDMGPPSIAEIRLHIRDSDPTDALWRGVIEFDAAEMAACIERPIRYFNEALPPLSTVKYNTANFPFRHNWLNGIVACLYEMAEISYMRVHLPYQAGGLSVDDKNKFREYGAKAREKWEDFKQWTAAMKRSMNAQNAIQSSFSPYSGDFWLN